MDTNKTEIFPTEAWLPLMPIDKIQTPIATVLDILYNEINLLKLKIKSLETTQRTKKIF